MDFGKGDRPTTAICVRVKRYEETYYVLCDEYETVESLKNRLLLILQRIKFELPKQEEPMTADDVRYYIKNRVTQLSLFLTCSSVDVR